MTPDGVPVEFCLVPGKESDVKALYKLPLDVAPQSVIYIVPAIPITLPETSYGMPKASWQGWDAEETESEGMSGG